MREIDEETRKKIAEEYETSTAKEIAGRYGISERQVRRIAKEEAERAEPGEQARKPQAPYVTIDEEYVKGELIRLYNMNVENAEHYHGLAKENPTNCAWGNLEVRFLASASELMKKICDMSGIKNIDADMRRAQRMTARDLVYSNLEEKFKDASRRDILNFNAEMAHQRINWDVVDKEIAELEAEELEGDRCA